MLVKNTIDNHLFFITLAFWRQVTVSDSLFGYTPMAQRAPSKVVASFVYQKMLLKMSQDVSVLKFLWRRQEHQNGKI
jgi:hypothetical protein